VNQPRAASNPMTSYKKICVAVDGSELSNAAARLGVLIARQDQAEVIGSHIYAARLHDQRFRAMESGLPERYQKEPELEKQRNIHDSLIGKGLRLISDSYLEVLRDLCNTHGIPFTPVSLEGKNWLELVNDIQAHDYDLVALGGHGLGRVPEAELGTVTLRLLRRVKRDVLICTVPAEQVQSDRIVVCLDGSARSWGALQRGLHLTKLFQKKLVALAAFDPFFHHAMFSTLNEVLSVEARKVFRFEEQEKLHDSIINTGLAKIYQSHLDIAQRVCREQNVELETHLLTGKVYSEVLRYVREQPPWLLVLGRLGIHSAEDMDIGGNAENICRRANCNLLVVELQSAVPPEYQAEQTLAWTQEARARMERVPSMARGLAIKAVQEHALAQGHTVITSSVLTAALESLLPAGHAAEAATTRGEVSEFRWTDAARQRLERVPAGFMRTAAQQSIERFVRQNGIAEISLDVAEAGLAKTREQMATVFQGGAANLPAESEPAASSSQPMETTGISSFECILCGFIVDGSKPDRCPSCRIGELMKLTEAARKIASPTATKNLQWEPAALERLERIPIGFMRTMTRCRIEHRARKFAQAKVTLEVVEAKYQSWKGGSHDLTMKLRWSPDALQRVERIPEFIRAKVVQEIESHASAMGKNHIDSEVLDRVVEKWGNFQSFHSHP